jgi:hypothetical protein
MKSNISVYSVTKLNINLLQNKEYYYCLRGFLPDGENVAQLNSKLYT